MTFDQDVLAPLRRWTGRNLRVPTGSEWEADDLGADGVRVTVTLPAAAFDRNLQDDLPAAPFFALCLAYWHERRTGTRSCARVRIAGTPADTPHATRLRFVLHELAGALPDRLVVEPAPAWPLPSRLVMNQQVSPRDTSTRRGPVSEAALERRIVATPALRQDFSARVAPIDPFRRQLPLGLFVGSVASDNALLPRGAAQVDLWATSPDRKVLHLFELKAGGNAKVGILPEAFAYARLLHHVRTGRIGGDGEGLAAARRAERIVMWLIAPEYHPLVLFGDDSPVRWIHAGMAGEGVELRILPFDLAEDGSITWRPDLAPPVVEGAR